MSPIPDQMLTQEMTPTTPQTCLALARMVAPEMVIRVVAQTLVTQALAQVIPQVMTLVLVVAVALVLVVAVALALVRSEAPMLAEIAAQWNASTVGRGMDFLTRATRTPPIPLVMTSPPATPS